MEEKKTKKSLVGSLVSIFQHADGVDKLLMLIGFLGAVCDGLALPASAFTMGRLVNVIGTSESLPRGAQRQEAMSLINKNSLAFCYIAIGQGIACFLEGYCWARTAERQASSMRTAYLKAVLRQEIAYFDLRSTDTSEVVATISNDSLVIQDFISEKVPYFVSNLSSFVGAYIAAFFILWRLTAVGLPFLVLLIMPGVVYGRILMGISRRLREEYNKAGAILERSISSIRTVYSFVGEAKTVAKYSNSLQGTIRLGQRQGFAKGLAVGSNAIMYSVGAFLNYYGSTLVMYHGAQGGTVFAVVSILVYRGLSLGTCVSNLDYFSEAGAAAERIMEIIERLPKMDSDNMEAEILQHVKGDIEFQHVQFAYPSRPDSIVLKDFSLRIPAGSTTALVGGSGCGKSTSIAMLQRFYDPIGGEILLDGVPIHRLQLKWLRSQMGVVSQEPALFATTIKDNILFGKENASLEEVIEAAKASNAHDFICQLPHGYDTQVGERGIQMSGGQKQRIAIARAIIRSPKILLLDEATSALDSESERVVQETLEKVSTGRTSVVIAHRLSTIRKADFIAVVQNGKVVEAGSHDELIEDTGGLYTSLVRLQNTKTDTQFAHSKTKISSSAALASTSSNSRPSSASTVATTTHQAKHGAVSGDRAPSVGRLLAMSSPEWKQAFAGLISAILVGAIPPMYGIARGGMASVYFLHDHEEIKKMTKIYCILFVSLTLFAILINICKHFNFASMGENLTARIRETLLSKILTFEIGWYDRDENATGTICSRLGKDAATVRSLMIDQMALLVETFSTVTLSYVMGFFISWRLAWVLVVVQPLVIFSFYMKHVLLKTLTKKAIKFQEESSKIAAEAVTNIRTVASFNAQALILQIMEKAQVGPRQESIRQAWFAGIGLATSSGLLRLCWALDYWYGGKLVVDGSLRARGFLQSFMILSETGRVIANAGIMTKDLTKGWDTISSVFAILDRKSLIEPEDSAGHKPDKVRGQIELLDIDFAYPTRPSAMIFKGFSIKFEPGKSTALVGKSGSGKSTIISLIERFYDPQKGIVMIDNRDVKSYHLRTLRQHIALVSQEPVLFSGTIRQNITYGAAADVGESEIIEAAKAAKAHDFITGLKDGYDTFCGDNGSQLSGGQKQRIAIARATLKNPTILLLDEATSALDSHSEKAVLEALERAMVGRTSLVVAHRLSTIQNCDTIVVLDKGELVEKGTHSSLMAKGPEGAYFSLVSHQTTEE
ncbi:OLC1v1037080C1 [Oldenlandia corymbosa var. corymbosa]|uniref:OLC1v1037080C1 n=1 Tax=Oldenlandia corymbosa var. corymbosa TaxID=529605 RepID=A0AAV1CYW8_OLDCO|nr:OLC1v1037080C1 [Oldenlandia corymbosa var. corymbosa]